MRIATYNVEWFHALFDDAGRLLNDNRWSARQNVTRAQQIAGLATVFRALDADAVLVVEAPDVSPHRDGAVALANFAAHAGIRARRVCMGFANETQQEIMLLYDPDALTAVHDPLEIGAPRFDRPFRIDLDIDATEDLVEFSKPPLEARLETALGPIRLIGVHVKSKAPHGARDPDHAMKIAISNRRKQLAQCIWLRRRVDAHLAAGEAVILAGDLNDGPGLDVYEDLFGRSGVEIVMGWHDGAAGLMYDPHAARALERRIVAAPTTARFYIASEGRYLSALLDYVMVSPGLRAAARGWRVWHPFEDPGCWEDEGLRTALLAASDHFPVSVDLAPPG
ncbi:endonuclease/exonuclease/phosphatase family protein [Roseicyclus persicicus]|uniref:Endonuclease n=1 Tax=Roseicyclus persicicus TaxID=2650661 RepID=A0A7X6JXV1_9RHOB|nr:endonuclease/exonuclease/phosphatase family protein [Roseibacterium persicicum]NKX43450.1 endonuclease [Roseibacterium persicicum]